MADTSPTGEYVLLPPQGLRATGAGATPTLQSFFRAAGVGSRSVARAGGGTVPVKVLDAIAEDGAKLIQATPEQVRALRSAQPSMRVVPVVYYTPAVVPRHEVRAPATSLAATPRAAKPKPVTVKVVSETDGSPIEGAFVVAVVNVAANTGAQGITDKTGKAKLALGGANVKVERLYVYPVTAFWTMRHDDVTVTNGMQVKLHKLDLGFVDSLRFFAKDAPDDAGKGVTVGVVDTGVASHPDLVIAGGANTVAGEKKDDFGSNGDGHGTHVAGIVAARGTPPTGARGVAPGVKLRAYRVFAKGQKGAANFAIAKGIDQAVTDKCDVVNLSLGGGVADPVIAAAIEDARAAGTLVICAAGNNGRGPVSFPASDDLAVAVTALGRKGTFPADAAEIDDVVAPFGKDKKDFIGAFSNIGPQVDFTGPGVAVVSTYPGGYTEISGTSMAAPFVTGVAARLLAKAPKTLKAARKAARSEAILALLVAAAKDRGFTDPLEGHGLPLPPA